MLKGPEADVNAGGKVISVSMLFGNKKVIKTME
jgi:hypothetical protein